MAAIFAVFSMAVSTTPLSGIGSGVGGGFEPPSQEPILNVVTDTTDIQNPTGELVWSEEFDTLDTDRWKIENSTFGEGNSELQCYTPEQVGVANGSLVIVAQNREVTCPNEQTRDYTSGMVRSQDVTLEPGQRIEWRTKLTPADPENQAGLWPAFWASGWDGKPWPSSELDFFEVMTARDPSRTVYSIHYLDENGKHGKRSSEVYNDKFSDDWHDFEFDYGIDGVLVWRMDGIEVHRVVSAPTQQVWPSPFDSPVTELRINLALGGTPGGLDIRALPAIFEMDYIRVYEMTE